MARKITITYDTWDGPLAIARTWDGDPAAALAAAVQALEATLMPDGRYRYYAVETGCCWLVSAEDLQSYGAGLLAGDGDYSLWAATSEAEEV